MNTSASVVALHICSGHRKPMQSAESLEIITGKGIKGDMHALEESTRQILLIEHETLSALQLQPGDVKENITTSGISLMSLARGQELHLGEVILKITKECEPCNRMEEIRPGLKDELRGRRGVLARVVHGGTLRVGETLRVA